MVSGKGSSASSSGSSVDGASRNARTAGASGVFTGAGSEDCGAAVFRGKTFMFIGMYSLDDPMCAVMFYIINDYDINILMACSL